MSPPAPVGPRRGAALLLCVALAACGEGPDPPRWIDLAPRLEVAATGAAPHALGEGVRLAREGAEWWIESDLAASDWRRSGEGGEGGIFVAPRGLRGNARAAGEAGLPELRERAAGRAWRFVDRAGVPASPADAEPGTFALVDALVYACTAPGGAPPGDAVLREPFRPWRAADGRRAAEVGHLAAAGLALVTGQSATLELAPGEARGRALRFAVAAYGAEKGAGEAVLRVSADGAPVLETRIALGRVARVERHALELPEGARRIELAVGGAPAVAAVLAPELAPRSVGEYGARPWREARPDLVWLLADTFRADNMEAYGGAPGTTPRLDALAREALVFRRAWSPSTWTLPAHAALFAALFPHETGVVRHTDALPEEAVTIAEVLRAHGYRTVAVTEGGFVGRAFGMAQGFDWFEEGPRVVERTVARARAAVADDDGRPLFLFVHSYRPHAPYADAAGRVPGPEVPPLAAYRAASGALDAAFGALADELRARGLFESGVLLFTSDHGEAFGEHGVLGHGTGVWEEEIAVPLFLLGRGVAPGVVTTPVSTIDVAHTLARLADAPAHPGWRGRSLLAAAADGPPPIAVQCSDTDLPSEAALRAGDRKLFLPSPPGPAPEPLRLFDLATDPGERADLLAAEREEALRTLARWADLLRSVHEPKLGGRAAALAAEDVAELRGLGYLGGG